MNLTTRAALWAAATTVLFATACGRKEEPTSAPSTGMTTPASIASTTASTLAPSAPTSSPSMPTAIASTSAGAPVDAGASPIDGACADVATSICKKFDACMSTAMLRVVFDDVAGCIAGMKRVCVAELGAPDVLSTSADLTACAKAVRATPCGDRFDPDKIAACLWRGKRGSGAACGANAQCETSFCAKTDSTTECGKCAALPGEGAPCVMDRCATGLRCIAGKCARTATRGGACSSTAPCEAESYCVAGRCAPAAKLGEKCDPLGATAAGCAELVACDATTKTCRAPKLARVGEACGLLGTELVPCTRSWCERGEGDDGAAGKCALRAEIGGACTSNEACPLPSACIGKRCVMPEPAKCR